MFHDLGDHPRRMILFHLLSILLAEIYIGRERLLRPKDRLLSLLVRAHWRLGSVLFRFGDLILRVVYRHLSDNFGFVS